MLPTTDPIVEQARKAASDIVTSGAYNWDGQGRGPILVFDGWKAAPIVMAFVPDPASADGVLYLGAFASKEEALRAETELRADDKEHR